MINIYAPAYNESLMIGYFYRHYKQRFPKAKFTLIDNDSIDYTVPIAFSLGFDVMRYDTGGQLDDPSLLATKMLCWKTDKGWVLVCDMDEWLDINEDDLWDEYDNGTTVIQSKGYDMCNVDNVPNLFDVKYGVPNDRFNKQVLFRADKIEEMGWNMGCHTANPKGEVVYSKKIYNLWHMKYWNVHYMVDRYKRLQARKSEKNHKANYGIQYAMSEEQILNEYNAMMQKAQVVR
jgi:hypothetical protein